MGHWTDKTRKASIEVTVLWFNPCETVWHGKGRFRGWSLQGKGFGVAQDAEGNTYFLYGQEIGGGLYGEDADRLFMQRGRKLFVTEYWDASDSLALPSFFMGQPRRIKACELRSGRKPSKGRFDAMNERRKAKAA